MTQERPEVVTRQHLQDNRDTPGILRRVAFKTENNVMVEALVDGGVSSGWHHHGDRHVYAYLVAGRAILEYGPGGSQQMEIEAGSFFHLPPRVVHRDVNPSAEPQQWIISFVGEGLLVESTDGPDGP